MYFHLRNRQSGLMMSITGDFDDVKMLRIQETEETGGFEQIWLYQNGHLYCKVQTPASASVISDKGGAGTVTTCLFPAV